jgi:hypothetical protein
MKKLDIFEIVLPPEQKVVVELFNDLAAGMEILVLASIIGEHRASTLVTLW